MPPIYRKDWLQRRVLSAGLTCGLLTAEAHQWRIQRRALSPLFARKEVMNCSASMIEGANGLGERPIKAGTVVVIAPYVLHRHRALWCKPDRFAPNRFLGDLRRKIDRFANLPFGVGPRICIGATFAIQEASIVIATMMRHFRLELAPGHIA
ncbi:MAG: cytochrome P450 [Pseudolabrys sp.]